MQKNEIISITNSLYLSSDVISKQNRLSIESDILRTHDDTVIFSVALCNSN